VVDTMVASWLLDERPDPRAGRYREAIGGRRILLAFQTVAELRYGALHAGWGDLRRRALDRQLGAWTVVRSDDRTITLYAELRHQCVLAGHPLGAKVHDGDRWIAATALRVAGAVVSEDRIFGNVPGVEVLTAS
jgi:predicted nucleic acid-binding protein